MWVFEAANVEYESKVAQEQLEARTVQLTNEKKSNDSVMRRSSKQHNYV